jgi:hypothetical protein
MADAIVIAEAPKLIKLDLACGQSPREGFEGVDRWAPDAQHKVDLWKFPYPWADNSVDELHSSHFVEHLPDRPVEEKDIVYPNNSDTVEIYNRFIDQDFLFAFFDECWRMLKNNGTMLVICPNALSNRAFQDPTHRRFIVAETFLYLAKEWREINKLDHYKVRCDFGVNAVPIIPAELGLLHPEAQQRRFNESWNTVLDWQCSMTAKK